MKETEKMKKLLVLFFGALSLILLVAPDVRAQRRTVSGELAQTVEAGGWLIVENSGKYLLLNAQKFAGENWFRSGARVVATGEIKRGTITIYQEGIPFEAQTLRPAVNSSAANGGTTERRLTTVTVTGDARVSAQPDTAIISLSVVTQNRNAGEAQQQNATQTNAVINALKRAAGAAAEIKTGGYSLAPQRVYKENQPPTIVGYEARNSITVTTSDLNRVGAIIDAATAAGANNVDGISFTLRRDTNARGRALAEAAREGVNKADALAQALGGRVVRIVAVEEAGATPRPVFYGQPEALAASRAADTPIEVGALEIISQVRLVAEIELGAAPR